jgi:hypothetical protein
MLSVDDARTIAARWREQFVDEAAFDVSWSRYFETATVPDVQRLEMWLAKDLAKDAVKHAGIVKEPLLPTRSRYTVGDESDCQVCRGKRYVRRDLDVGHPDFGKAIRCTACSRD